jgi:hypothetical protein
VLKMVDVREIIQELQEPKNNPNPNWCHPKCSTYWIGHHQITHSQRLCRSCHLRPASWASHVPRSDSHWGYQHISLVVCRCL